MRFFPSLTENFTSPLPPAELLGHVQDCVQQARDFSGRVTGNQFSISRVIAYRNSMLPRISGAVMAGPGGAAACTCSIACTRSSWRLRPCGWAGWAAWWQNWGWDC
ncbi:MAG: hypothetical protein ACRYG7_37205 [Janthinobacterium lividum]